jgi:hypothetical protein
MSSTSAGDRAMETGDRQWAMLTYGRMSVTEVNVAVDVLNRMLVLDARAMSASSDPNGDCDRCVDTSDPCTTLTGRSFADDYGR